MFKCYIRVIGASTNPENVKKNNPENYLVFHFANHVCF